MPHSLRGVGRAPAVDHETDLLGGPLEIQPSRLTALFARQVVDECDAPPVLIEKRQPSPLVALHARRRAARHRFAAHPPCKARKRQLPAERLSGEALDARRAVLLLIRGSKRSAAVIADDMRHRLAERCHQPDFFATARVLPAHVRRKRPSLEIDRYPAEEIEWRIRGGGPLGFDQGASTEADSGHEHPYRRVMVSNPRHVRTRRNANKMRKAALAAELRHEALHGGLQYLVRGMLLQRIAPNLARLALLTRGPQ